MTTPRDARGDLPELTTLTVSREQQGFRLERLLMHALACSRSEARWLCQTGAVEVDGRRAPKGESLREGSVVRIDLGTPWLAAQAELALDVRLERPDLVVVDKAAGMPSAPLRPGERDTLANALVARYPEMREFGHSAREPGLIHRLDNQTSGLLVAARSAAAFSELCEGLRAGRLEKRYLAVVERDGLPPSGTIDKDLGPDQARSGRVREVTDTEVGYRRTATTSYRVVRWGERFALVEVAASRAFRHQVRAHLAAIGHPIAGDTLYGGVAEARLGERHALHASHVGYSAGAIPAFSVSTEPPPLFLELVGIPK